MDQEPPDELSRGEVHGLHSVSALDAIVFPSEPVVDDATISQDTASHPWSGLSPDFRAAASQPKSAFGKSGICPRRQRA